MSFIWPADGDLGAISTSDSINIFDSIDFVYTSSWSRLNLTLFCGFGGPTSSAVYYSNVPENPLPASGTYRLNLIVSGFAGSINNWPAPCFLKLTKWGDNEVQTSGKQFSILSRAGQSATYAANLASTVSSSSATSFTVYSIASTTSNTVATSSSISGSSSQSSNLNAPTSVSAPASSQDSGLSTGAKAGIGVGVVLAVIIIVLLSWLIVLLRRKRQRADEYAAPAGNPNPGYYAPAQTANHYRPELPAVSQPTQTHYEKYSDNDQHYYQSLNRPIGHQYTQAQELPGRSIR